MSLHPIEALLRPPVELWSALTAGAAVGVVALEPDALMMPTDLARAAAAALGFLTWLRASQGYRIVRYQRNLKRLSLYRLKAGEIPVSRNKLFLGKGFRWTQRHTQRLKDTQKPMGRPYVEPGAWYLWARKVETAWEDHPRLQWVSRLLTRDAWWNPLAPLPPVGGKAALHGVELDERDVWMPLYERVGHTLVLGTTRVGKTRLAEILITQDIRRGDVTIVFDPKGDADLMKRVVAEAHRAGRQNALFVFHLGYPEISARYNPIASFSRITEVATRIANQLPSQGNAAAFREFAWHFTNIVARTLVALGQRPDYTLITRYVRYIEPLLLEYYRHWLPQVAPPDWQQAVVDRAANIDERQLPFELKGRSHEVIALVQYAKEAGLYDPVADGLRTVFEYDKKYFDKLVVGLQPLMEKLISGKTRELIAPDYSDIDDPRPIFDWMQIIRRKGIVYVGLDALSDMAVSQAVGNSMFADLVSVAGHVYKHGVDGALPEASRSRALPVINLHCDEFNELIGDEFIPMVNKGGGAGFQVTAYTQTAPDIEARLGNAAKTKQVIGNFNTTLMLRVKDFATAELMTNQLDQVEVYTRTPVSGAIDSSDPTSEVDYISRNEDSLGVSEVPLITPADIMSLPKGQAFALLEGGQLWKIRMALPDPAEDLHMPQDLQAVAELMARKYSTGDHWWGTAAATPLITVAKNG
ncbi:type IV conjugative transfer system coupling protein TraD [Methyloterricola oryzae]|uniref:type IV conjugative transfer system coupling protein TraD n=1 Tax=Methyloterricola oryzae TaxID=1495050 RepID=UPI0005EBD3FD|nr:type IV conjugative transfer system coupling protein TraD [Methyloterricola oryzae]